MQAKKKQEKSCNDRKMASEPSSKIRESPAKLKSMGLFFFIKHLFKTEATVKTKIGSVDMAQMPAVGQGAFHSGDETLLC